MNYKKEIVNMLKKADKDQLKKLYHFIKGFLGLS